MLFDIVIIVLRETLEASVLIGIFLALCRKEGMSFSWLGIALLMGLVGGSILALNLATISELLDYTGQEVMNASLQYLIYGLIVSILISYVYCNQLNLLIKGCMAAAVVLALSREGCEVIVFYYGFAQTNNTLFTLFTSGFIGLAIGASVGVIVYYLLTMQNLTQSKTPYIVLLSLMAGGMVMQANQMLIQADWITAGAPWWDTRWLLPESSLLGEVAYAIFGYEATPSRIEAISYLVSIMVIYLMIVSVLLNQSSRQTH